MRKTFFSQWSKDIGISISFDDRMFNAIVNQKDKFIMEIETKNALTGSYSSIKGWQFLNEDELISYIERQHSFFNDKFNKFVRKSFRKFLKRRELENFA